MAGTVFVGAIFGGILLWAIKRARKDIMTKKCSCGSSCGRKNQCHQSFH